MESRSGETYSPHQSRSSPVLTINVSSSGATTSRSPSTNLAPPVPPVSTTIIQAPWRSRRHPQPPLLYQPASRVAKSLSPRTPDTPAISAASGILYALCVFEVVQDAAKVFQD